MNSRKDVVAERKGINDPQASCFSGFWLTITVVSPFAISGTDRKDMLEEIDSKDNARLRERDIEQRGVV